MGATGQTRAKVMQMREFLEGVAQKDQAQDLELLAEGLGHGTGQNENEVHDFLDQDQGEGQTDGVEMRCRRESGQQRRQQAPHIQFDADDAYDKGHDLAYGHDAPGLRALPESMPRYFRMSGLVG